MKAQGKAHVVRKRTVTVEEHFDDCGEDLSSLKGAETIAAWTSSIFEDAHHGLEDEAHSAICDGLERVILNDTAAHPQRLLAGVTHYAALGEVPPGRLLQHPWVEIAEFQAAPQSVLLTVRRQLDDHQVSDFVAPLDIQSPEIQSYLMSNNVTVAIICPTSTPEQLPQCWWEPWQRRSDTRQTWCQETAQIS